MTITLEKRHAALCDVAQKREKIDSHPPKYCGVHFRDGYATASDGYALMRVAVGMNGDGPVTADAQTLKSALKMAAPNERAELAHGIGGDAAPLTLTTTNASAKIEAFDAAYPDVAIVNKCTPGEPERIIALNVDRVIGVFTTLKRLGVQNIHMDIRPQKVDDTMPGIAFRGRDFDGKDVLAVLMPMMLDGIK